MYKRDIYLDIDDNLNNYIKSVELDSNSRVWHFHLTVDYQPLNLTGKTVMFMAEKPDKTNVLNDCEIIDAENGIVKVELTRQVNAVPGHVNCLLKIVGSDGYVLKTKTFIVEVSKTLSDNPIVSTNEFSALDEALGRVQNIDQRFAETNAQLSEISTNVKSYGYDNTGKNDTSNIFDSLLVDNSCIYFPQGEYLIRKNILIENRSNITLEGNLSKILLDYQCEITFSNCNNITLKNMNIESNKYHLNFVKFNNCTNLVIENCTFNGNGFLNWDISTPDTTNGTKYGLLFRACEKVIIQKCVIKGFWFRDSLDFFGCKNVKILCNNISYVGGGGITLKNSNTDFTIKDNTLENCCVYNWTNGQGGTDGVIDTYGPTEQGQTPNTHILIENNYISKFGVNDAQLSGIRVSGSQYIIIKKNTIENAYTDGTISILIQPRDRGDMFTVSHNILISENTLQATDSQYFMGCLQFNGECRDVTITKNTFNNHLTNANVWGQILYVKTEVANLYITDNIIGDYSNAIIGVAISIKNNHKGVFIKNNSIHALKTSIHIENSSNIIADNNNLKSTYSNVAYVNTTNLRITNNVLSGNTYIVPNEGVNLENNFSFI